MAASSFFDRFYFPPKFRAFLDDPQYFAQHVRQRDEDAVACLYRCIYLVVRRRLFNLDDVEDCSQALVERLVRQFDQAYEERNHFLSWIVRVGTNAAISFQRMQIARNKICTAWPNNFEPVAGEKPSPNDLAQRIQLVVRQLPANSRRLLGYLVEGLSYKEIAALENLPVSTVVYRIFSLRREIKSLIDWPNCE